MSKNSRRGQQQSNNPTKYTFLQFVLVLLGLTWLADLPAETNSCADTLRETPDPGLEKHPKNNPKPMLIVPFRL
ncbi:MAG: hypothetical protein DMG74_17545 [Acidobacteria bacterium]|nr:MAG: hypothetical protein DMG74_17545 [Acidobacteriota bacterium]